MIELLTCLWIGAYCLQEVPHPSADSSHHHWPEAGPSLLHPLHSCLQAVLHSHAPHTPHCVVRIGHALGHHSDASRHCCLCPTSLGHWHCTAPGKKERKKLHFELLMFTQDLRVHLMAGICWEISSNGVWRSLMSRLICSPTMMVPIENWPCKKKNRKWLPLGL